MWMEMYWILCCGGCYGGVADFGVGGWRDERVFVGWDLDGGFGGYWSLGWCEVLWGYEF